MEAAFSPTRLAPHGVEAVCGPLVGGAFVAQAVAAELDAEFFFAERITSEADGRGQSVRYRLPEGLRPRVRGAARRGRRDQRRLSGSGTVADLACGARLVAVGAMVVLGDRAEVHQPAKGFESYFLTFPGGNVRLEVMSGPELSGRTSDRAGFAHPAIAVGSEAAVDALAVRLRTNGCEVVDGPHRTGGRVPRARGA